MKRNVIEEIGIYCEPVLLIYEVISVLKEHRIEFLDYKDILKKESNKERRLFAPYKLIIVILFKQSLTSCRRDLLSFYLWLCRFC